MNNLTPREIVEALDRYIIGQQEAKHAVAVAIRNRWRRQQLDPELARDITPKNIVMIGPTGVGKTEIARRLASLTGAPFVKVEASKFTEVGYHGRDVETMIRDLVDQAVAMVRAEEAERVRKEAEAAAEERLLELLLPAPRRRDEGPVATEASDERQSRTRQMLREKLEQGELDEREVQITVSEKPGAQVMLGGMGMDQMDPQMSQVFERLIPEQQSERRVSVTEARRILTEQETESRLDEGRIRDEALERTEESGIVFLDEIDKVAIPEEGGGGRGPDISREGVQRDLLPIVEGSAVSTRHGVVQTDHVLFIAAGAFHATAISDLMPELQGRFPIRVSLQSLGRGEFIQILTEPSNALTHQQAALLDVEGLTLHFEPEAIEAMADLAARANESMENIGARRLVTVVERLFEEVNFDAPERVAAGEQELRVTGAMVRERVGPAVEEEDLAKFVL